MVNFHIGTKVHLALAALALVVGLVGVSAVDSLRGYKAVASVGEPYIWR